MWLVKQREKKVLIKLEHFYDAISVNVYGDKTDNTELTDIA